MESRNSVRLPQPIKIEPVESDTKVHYPKLTVLKQRGQLIGSDKVEQNIQLQLNLCPIDIELKQPDAMKTHERKNGKTAHGNRKLSKKQSIQLPAEQKTYSCHLCGKMFPHLCRLKSHMPAHSRERPYKCSLCPKQYKSASSLSLHYRMTGHSNRAHDVQKKSSIQLATPEKSPIKTSKVDFKNECNKFETIKMDQTTMKEMELEMEWSPLESCCVDYVPFVWDESDLKLTLPMDNKVMTSEGEEQSFGTEKVNGLENSSVVSGMDTADEMHRVNSSILKVCDAVNRPKVKAKRLKCSIWQKETVDPSAWYVDILGMSTAKRLTTDKTSDSGNSKSSMKSTKLAIQFHVAGDNDFKLKQWDSARQFFNRGL